MRRELLVPKLGLTMTEGVLVEWMVRPGEAFKAEQGLFVIESEKAANEIGAEADGVLLEVCAEVGATLPCGAVMGYWDDAPGLALAQAQPDGARPEGGVSTSAPAVELARQGEPEPHPHAPAAPVPAIQGQPEARQRVTPLARRLAKRLGVPLAEVIGTGPRGRIKAADVELHARQQPAPMPASPIVAPAPTAAAAATPWRGVLCAPSALERTVAQRLTAAKQQTPHFYLSVEAEMSAILALRRELNEAQSRHRFTLNHFVLAAVGQALEALSEVNRVWTDEGILQLEGSDVGMAVQTDRGLMVPVLRDVGRLSLGRLAELAGDHIARAQAGRLASAEMQGGAITVSNAGMHDVTYMASIINPGQSMILGVGSIREVFRPDVSGQPVIRREMGLVLSADHRVLDGVTGLRFLKQVVQALGRPAGLLVAG